MHTRRWLLCATVGFAAVIAVLVVTTLVLVDKKHFGWLVGTLFLQVIATALVAGALLTFIGTWRAAARADWRRTALLIWAVIAAVSPMAGYLFILPFGLLALALPVVVPALVTLWRDLPAS